MVKKINPVHDIEDNNKIKNFLKIIKKIKYIFPELPFKTDSRSIIERPKIFNRLISSFLNDEERAIFFGFPEGCRVREGVKIFSKNKLEIGPFCWIGENAILDASGGLKIGSHTSIGLSVFIWTHSSHLANLNKDNKINSNLIIRGSTKIGSGCFISGPSVIMPGVEIGDFVIVKPFSRIEKNIPSRSIVDGSKIKAGVLSEKMINKMLKNKQ